MKWDADMWKGSTELRGGQRKGRGAEGWVHAVGWSETLLSYVH